MQAQRKKKNRAGKSMQSCQHQELIRSRSQMQQMAGECKRNWAIKFLTKHLEGCRGKWEERRRLKMHERAEGAEMERYRMTGEQKVPIAAICSRLRLHLFQCNFNHAIMPAMSTDRSGCAKNWFCFTVTLALNPRNDRGQIHIINTVWMPFSHEERKGNVQTREGTELKRK